MSKNYKIALGFVVALGLVVANASFAASAPMTFSRNLSKGATGADVKQLQQFLNSCADTQLASAAGTAGSAGFETMYFGPATVNAVKAYQTKNGVSPVLGNFFTLTRAKAAAVGNVCGTTGGNTGGQTQTGPLTVSLATDNPAAGYYAGNQAGAELLKVTFTGTGTVTNVTLQKIGVAADASYNNIYLFDGATRLTDGASVSNNGVVSFANPSGLFTVNGSRTITVKVDLASSGSEVVGVKLTGYQMAGSTTPVSVMVSGNQFSLVNASGLATVTLGGSMLPSAGSIDPQTDFVVWQNQVTVSNRAAWLKSLALREIGSINAGDVTNFRLWIDGNVVATTPSLVDSGSGYYVTLVPSAPYSLATGSHTVKVMADVVGGSYRNFTFQLRNKVDMSIVDSSSGYGISVGGTVPASAGQISINQGNMTIQKATDSPSGDVIYNGTDVVLAKYTLRTFGEAVKIDTIKVSSTQSSGTAGLRSGRLLINGQQVGSTATLAEDSAGTPYTIYNTNYTLQAGTTSTLEVRADLYDVTGGVLAALSTVKVNVEAGTSNAQGVSSGQVFSLPSSQSQGNTVTVKSGSMTVAKNATYPNQATVVPQTNYKLGSWTVTGGSVEDINLDTFTFTAPTLTDAFAIGDIINVTMKVDGQQVGTIKSTVTSPFSFSASVLLPKSSSKTIDLYADILSSATDGDGTADTIGTSLAVSGTTTPSGASVAPSTVAGQVITANSSGTLTASADASAPLSRIVSGSQSDVNVGAFKFAAVNDSFTVKEVTVKVPSGANTVITAVKLKDQSGNLVGSAQALDGSSVTFSGLNFSIPSNTNSKYFTVFADLGMIGTSNGTSGSEITATLDSFKYSDSTGVETTDGTDVPLPSKAYYAYKAIPTITNVNLPSTVLAAGTQTIAKFNVAATGGPITWKKIKLSNAASGLVTVASPILVDENGTTIPTTTASISGGVITFVLTNEEEISTSKTYVVKATIGGVIVTGDNVSTSIPAGVSSYAIPDDYTAVAGTATSFAWSDKADVSHDATSTSITDWNNNFLVKNIPTDSHTLSK